MSTLFPSPKLTDGVRRTTTEGWQPKDGFMSKHLERDLENLQRDILALAASVEEAIHKAIRSLQDRDVELAKEGIHGDDKIDEEENAIEQECLKMLALHQPVASDLRRVAAALVIN